VARRQHLAREKEFTRLRDQLSRDRRELPWVAVAEQFVRDGPKGAQTLSDLFDGRRQLLVYHFIVRSGLGTGLPELVVLGRQLRPHRGAPRPPRRHPGRGVAHAAFTPEERASGMVDDNFGQKAFPYHMLDLVPRGRDEDALPYSMAWLRHRDRYDD
jgi:predicted dithiol-disulfide oxidoreductase (DUF899 family)